MCVQHYQFKCSGLKAYLKDIDHLVVCSALAVLRLIVTICDLAPVKSAQSALVEGALPCEGSGEHHEGEDSCRCLCRQNRQSYPASATRRQVELKTSLRNI